MDTESVLFKMKVRPGGIHSGFNYVEAVAFVTFRRTRCTSTCCSWTARFQFNCTKASKDDSDAAIHTELVMAKVSNAPEHMEGTQMKRGKTLDRAHRVGLTCAIYINYHLCFTWLRRARPRIHFRLEHT